MADAVRMTYDTDSATQAYKQWQASNLAFSMARHVNLQYFGSLEGATVVEFGCGSGAFLKQCLNLGAASCLGFDVNDAMIKSGEEAATQKQYTTEQLQFVITDCFKSIQGNYGQFDFAVSQFVLHDCNNEDSLQIYLRNVYEMLKSGKKMFVSLFPYVTNTKKDQEIVADLCGYFVPLRADSTKSDPYFAKVPAFRPGPVSDGKTGRPFTRDRLIEFSDHKWSIGKLMENLRKCGFINIAQLKPSFPDNVPINERGQIESLEDPFVLIGAEKP